MTKTLAIELGPFNVNVNCVAPGFIATAMTEQTAERMGGALRAADGSGRSTDPAAPSRQPEDVAATIAFLCSEDASYVSGQVILRGGRPAQLTRPRRP